MSLLYHEKQVAALCGVHTLNTLLQGPYFSEIDLAQIAHGLDALERELLGDALGNEASGNVAMDGMFSIQVLSRALESWGLTVLSLESEEARDLKAAPTSAEAFICNLQEHWFTLRRVADGEWWNFNSLFPAPQPLSTFYLTAFLDTLREEGWTIFVIRGKLPATQPGGLETLPNAGKWWSAEDARAATDEAERARKRGRVANALETALARAGEQGGSLQLRTRGTPAAAAGGNDDEDADLAAAIAASLQGGAAAGAAAGAGPGPGSQAVAAVSGGLGGSGFGAAAVGGGDAGFGHGLGEFEDEDPELAMAIAASLADQPAGAAGAGPAAGADGRPGVAAAAGGAAQPPPPEPEPLVVELPPEPEEGAEGAIELAFRLPSGGRVSRRFLASQPAACLATYLAQQLGVAPGRVAVATQFPRKELTLGADTPLSELGLTHRTMLLAESRK
ncbi:hypothetical protein HYH02_010117 [Chlamydomonas schloesseri]|uniref:Ataxin-3 homolog n=1 Tax=Chlamydomonas schloesseri TaxID=2026947 RepID=A0A835TM66_9CHLO|nr:hypothetical protein HYH02_010117 [Chlamydomonas schloesseri]|eukprot:KAG2441276.1 hypothetical protein HYH02_010117 [Chlamydomonas schloesseri]